MRRASPVALLIAGTLAVASCGGDTADTTTTTAAAATTAATTATTSTTTTSTLPTTTTTIRTIPATDTTIVVQQDLTVLGYYEGPIDGIAGEQTSAAIARFQADAGIEADGVFGPVTDAAMVPELQADPTYVELVQEELTERGFYRGPIDGDYGRGTKAGVERAQADCEIEETGELDIDTRLCLFAP